MSISTLAAFKSFKTSSSIKARTMMNKTEKILLTLILCRRRRKKRNYLATRSKPRFWMQNNFIRRKQHGEFHRLV